ncbi:MAG: winged helix-turn-helix transcriptional regulator [Candidatus Thermoplasmatota archaeon]|nr:winged helix-turn-helix transcriptional regulator [Candidatus Thermoplasmatota archaeon]
MSNAQSDKSGYGPVYERSSSIASLLKSAANPYRIRILALAMRGNGDFSEMMDAMALSKTALANHLAQLVDAGLMRRQARGKYELTSDGKELLSAAFSTYKRSARRVEEEKDMIKRSYGIAYGQPDQVGRRTISKDAKYEPCWLSLLGAISGSLNALGNRTSIVEVGGYTGYPFLINVSIGETCPSGPTALHIKTFLEILGGIDCLGWHVQNREYPHSYPSRPGAPSPEDLKIAREVFERIRKEIDQRDRPVVLYGLVAPEYGIVRGYEGESYLVSTFRSIQNPGVEEEPVPYHKLNAPGCVDEIYFAERVKVRSLRARKEALARALRFAEGDVEMQRNYVSGPPALAEWASVLEEATETSQNYMGNSYVGACVQEGREISSAFLKKIAKQAPKSQSRDLSRASASYAKGARSLAEFTKLFPFRFEGKMPARKRRRGAVLLRDAQEHEERAIQHLRKVA